MNAPFCEIVPSVMWTANPTRLDIAKANWAIARFPQDPKPIHYKAAQVILKYLKATSDMGVLFKRGSVVGSIQSKFD